MGTPFLQVTLFHILFREIAMSVDMITKDYIVSSTYLKHEQSGETFEAMRRRNSDGRSSLTSKQWIPPLVRTFGIDKPLSDAGDSICVRETDVAVVTRARRLAGVSMDDFLAGAVTADPSDPVEMLAAIVAYTGMPMRWEPLNSSREHRGVPSPRSPSPPRRLSAGTLTLS